MGKLNRLKRAAPKGVLQGIIKKKKKFEQTEFNFDGKTYDPKLDGERLGKQFMRVWLLMQDAKWRTLWEIENFTGDPQASISARLRDFRKRKYGEHLVGRRRRVGGLFEYQLVLEGQASD